MLNEGFLRAIAGMMSGVGGLAIIFAPIMAILIYVTMATVIVQKAFTLIYALPDNVPDWAFGAQGSSRWGSGVAQAAADETKSTVSSGMGSMAQGAGNMLKEPKEKGGSASMSAAPPAGGDNQVANVQPGSSPGPGQGESSPPPADSSGTTGTTGSTGTTGTTGTQ
jgi:hypothetical protein